MQRVCSEIFRFIIFMSASEYPFTGYISKESTFMKDNNFYYEFLSETDILCKIFWKEYKKKQSTEVWIISDRENTVNWLHHKWRHRKCNCFPDIHDYYFYQIVMCFRYILIILFCRVSKFRKMYQIQINSNWLLRRTHR